MSTKENHEKLIYYLEKESVPVSAKRLSKYLNVSTRTVRTYIHNINMSNLYKISSSKKGYMLNYVKNTNITNTLSKPKQRYSLILHELLSHITVDYFELADALHISIPTIEKDILSIKSNLKNYNLSLIKHGSLIRVKGKEEDIRSIITDLLKKEVASNYLGINYIQSIYKDIAVDIIKNTITTNLEMYNYKINEYLLDNLILHISIAIDRIKNTNTLDSVTMVNSKFNDKVTHKIAQNIVNDLETKFDIIFSDTETSYIELLLMTKTLTIDVLNNKDISIYQYLDPKYIDNVKHVIKKVDDYYYININSNEFIINFSLHVQNLATRSKYNKKISNPLILDLKKHHPFIYDLSVFVSDNLKKLLAIDINEDEIAFISMHLGSYIEQVNELENKVKCAVICPEYYSMKTDLIKNIEDKFDNQINIVAIYSNIDEFINDECYRIDLILTTYPIQFLNINIDFLNIPPFFSKKTYKLIFKKIQEIEKLKTKKNLNTNLIKYLDSSFFEKNIYLANEHEYIEYMGEKLVFDDIIKNEDIKLMHERENLSSTAFNSYVAIPHSIEMIAKKTVIFIIINENVIKWGDLTVKIIAMVVMNKKEQKEFRIVFDFITELLSNRNSANLLAKSSSYQDFINNIVDLV